MFQLKAFYYIYMLGVIQSSHSPRYIMNGWLHALATLPLEKVTLASTVEVAGCVHKPWLTYHHNKFVNICKQTFHISWNTCSSCPLTLHICSRTGCLTFSARTMKKVSILCWSRISLRVLPLPGMEWYLLSRRSSVCLVTWTFLKDEKLPFYPIR